MTVNETVFTALCLRRTRLRHAPMLEICLMIAEYNQKGPFSLTFCQGIFRALSALEDVALNEKNNGATAACTAVAFPTNQPRFYTDPPNVACFCHYKMRERAQSLQILYDTLSSALELYSLYILGYLCT